MPTSAFDSYAAGYDDHFTNSPIGVLQRKRVHQFLFPFLRPDMKVLEINSGTGYDAAAIAPKVKLVHASDISPSMILEARNKNIPAGNIRFITADTRELPSMLQSEYDLLFSNFGGLNCLSAEEIKTFATRMAPFISGDGKLALVVMGRKCIWENFLFRWQKDKRVNRRKAVGGVNTNLGGTTFKTYYYSPSELEGLFSVHFRKVQLRPVGLFIPPSYLNPYFRHKRGLLRLLDFFDRLTGHLPFADYADHYFIVLEKKNPSTGHKI